MTDHWHGDVLENNNFTDRSKCFTGDAALIEARTWLSYEMGDDLPNWNGTRAGKEKIIREMLKMPLGDIARLGYWEHEWLMEGDRKVVMSYRIMQIDGACEAML